MKFTFGIVSSFNTARYLEEVIESIRSQNIEYYEIILIGDELSSFYSYDTKILEFNEKTKKPWISKKKNLITTHAKYENIVYMHDYLKLAKNWYVGYLNFNKKFDICINPILNNDGSRYRDWTLFYKNNTRFDKFFVDTGSCLLPYSEASLSKFMYISGAYWIAKKEFMLKNPIDNNRYWGDSEDVEWSFRVRRKTNFILNTESSVILMKQKDPLFNIIKTEDLKDFKKYTKSYKLYIDKLKIIVKKLLNKIFFYLNLKKRFSFFDINNY